LHQYSGIYITFRRSNTDIKDDIPMPMVYILSLYHLLNLNTGEHYCGVIIFVLIDPECLQ